MPERINKFNQVWDTAELAIQEAEAAIGITQLEQYLDYYDPAYLENLKTQEAGEDPDSKFERYVRRSYLLDVGPPPIDEADTREEAALFFFLRKAVMQGNRKRLLVDYASSPASVLEKFQSIAGRHEQDFVAQHFSARDSS